MTYRDPAARRIAIRDRSRAGQLSRSTASRCRTKRDLRSALLEPVNSGRRLAGAATPGSAELLSNISYEVMPLKSTEEAVLASVPTTIPLTVTVTEARGMEATLRLTERLVRHGYRVAPHLAARQFVDQNQVADVVARLREAGVRSVFVIGGDSPTADGAFPDAYSLLQAMRAVGHPFEEIGIAGYPEGHRGHLAGRDRPRVEAEGAAGDPHHHPDLLRRRGDELVGRAHRRLRCRPAGPRRPARAGEPTEAGADLGGPRAGPVGPVPAESSRACCGGSCCPAAITRPGWPGSSAAR